MVVGYFAPNLDYLNSVDIPGGDGFSDFSCSDWFGMEIRGARYSVRGSRGHPLVVSAESRSRIRIS
jgi:hypothetical protein